MPKGGSSSQSSVNVPRGGGARGGARNTGNKGAPASAGARGRRQGALNETSVTVSNPLCLSLSLSLSLPSLLPSITSLFVQPQTMSTRHSFSLSDLLEIDRALPFLVSTCHFFLGPQRMKQSYGGSEVNGISISPVSISPLILAAFPPQRILQKT